MANFPKRMIEMSNTVFENQSLDLNDVKADLDMVTVSGKYTLAMKEVQRYCDDRGVILTGFLKTLEERPELSAIYLQTRWSDMVLAAGQQVVQRFLAIPNNIVAVEKAPRLRDTMWELGMQESRFFKDVAELPLAFTQGSLLTDMHSFKHESNKLMDKWKALGDEARTPDDMARITLSKIHELFSETVAKITEADRGLPEKLRNFKPDPSKPVHGRAGEIIVMLLGGVNTVIMQRLEAYRRSVTQYAADAEKAFAGKELIAFCFVEIRSAVRAFMEKTNLRLAIADFEKHRTQALEEMKTCPTDAQREDGAYFVTLGFIALDPLLKSFRATYEEFITQNSEIFVGPVGLSNLEKLLELSANETLWASAERTNIQSALKQMYEHRVEWTLTLDGLSPEDSQELQKMLAVELEPLVKGMVAAAEDRLIDQLRAMMTDKTRRILDRISDSRGGEV